jgi:hypothetical protein
LTAFLLEEGVQVRFAVEGDDVDLIGPFLH